jgi:hypothetical protein
MNLSRWQRIMRRLSLHFASSYTHPDGTIELDIDEKAGIDPTVDDEGAQRRKFATWNKREAIRQDRMLYFLYGGIAGGIIVYWWLR